MTFRETDRSREGVVAQRKRAAIALVAVGLLSLIWATWQILFVVPVNDTGICGLVFVAGGMLALYGVARLWKREVTTDEEIRKGLLAMIVRARSRIQLSSRDLAETMYVDWEDGSLRRAIEDKLKSGNVAVEIISGAAYERSHKISDLITDWLAKYPALEFYRYAGDPAVHGLLIDNSRGLRIETEYGNSYFSRAVFAAIQFQNSFEDLKKQSERVRT